MIHRASTQKKIDADLKKKKKMVSSSQSNIFILTLGYLRFF